MLNELESKSPARGLWPNGYRYNAMECTQKGMRGRAIARCCTFGCTAAWEYVQHAGEVGAELRHIGEHCASCHHFHVATPQQVTTMLGLYTGSQ